MQVSAVGVASAYAAIVTIVLVVLVDKVLGFRLDPRRRPAWITPFTASTATDCSTCNNGNHDELITVIIQPDKLDEVRESLIKAEITRPSPSRAAPPWPAPARNQGEDMFRGQLVVPDLIPKIRLDIACNDDYVDIAIDAILAAAKHGDGTSATARSSSRHWKNACHPHRRARTNGDITQ